MKGDGIRCFIHQRIRYGQFNSLRSKARSRLEDKLCANLVRRSMTCIVEPLCVECKTEGGLDTGTECLSIP